MLASLRSDRWTTSPEQVDGLTGIRNETIFAPLYSQKAWRRQCLQLDSVQHSIPTLVRGFWR